MRSLDEIMGVIDRFNTREIVAGLLEENARLRGLLREFVGDPEAARYEDAEADRCWFCESDIEYIWSDGMQVATYPHTPDCLVTRARAALAPEDAP